MKILFYTENTHCGGLDTFIITLINNWPVPEDEISLMCNYNHPGLPLIQKKINRQCDFITYSAPFYWNAYQSIIEKIPQQKGLQNFLKLLLYPLRYLLFVHIVFKLAYQFYNQKFNRLMVINGGYPGGLFCRFASIAWGIAKKPLSIHNFHNYCTPIRLWDFPLESTLDTLVYFFSKKMVSVSSHCLKSLLVRKSFSDFSKMSFIYNGISMPEERNQNKKYYLQKKLNLPPESQICLMLGTYEPRKGHVFLFESFEKVVRKYPQAYLLVCGYGYPQEKLKVKKNLEKTSIKNNVFLFDFETDIDSLIAGSDLLLVPSQKDESFGLTIVEAMARQTPVVATKVGGIPEVLGSNVGGYLVDPSNTNDFAGKILMLLQNPELRKQVGVDGYQRYQSLFTAEKMAQAYANLIRE